MGRSILVGFWSQYISPWVQPRLQRMVLKYPRLGAVGARFQKSKLAQFMVYLRPFFRGLRRIAVMVGPGVMSVALLSLAFLPEAQTFVAFEPSNPTGASVEKVVQDLPFTAVGVLPNVNAQLAFLIFLIYFIFFMVSRIFSAVLNGLFSVYLFRAEVLSVCHWAQNNYLCWDFGGIKLGRYLDLPEQYNLFSKVYPNFSLEQFQKIFYPETASLHNIYTLQVEGANRMSDYLEVAIAPDPAPLGWGEGFSQPVFGISTQTGLSPEMVTFSLGMGVVTLIYLVWRFSGSGPGGGGLEEIGADGVPAPDPNPDADIQFDPDNPDPWDRGFIPHGDPTLDNFHQHRIQYALHGGLNQATDEEIQQFLLNYNSNDFIYSTPYYGPIGPYFVRREICKLFDESREDHEEHMKCMMTTIKAHALAFGAQHHPYAAGQLIERVYDLRIKYAPGFEEYLKNPDIDDFTFMRKFGATSMSIIGQIGEIQIGAGKNVWDPWAFKEGTTKWKTRDNVGEEAWAEIAKYNEIREAKRAHMSPQELRDSIPEHQEFIDQFRVTVDKLRNKELVNEYVDQLKVASEKSQVASEKPQSSEQGAANTLTVVSDKTPSSEESGVDIASSQELNESSPFPPEGGEAL